LLIPLSTLTVLECFTSVCASLIVLGVFEDTPEMAFDVVDTVLVGSVAAIRKGPAQDLALSHREPSEPEFLAGHLDQAVVGREL
jgi:hypothetical protein